MALGFFNRNQKRMEQAFKIQKEDFFQLRILYLVKLSIKCGALLEIKALKILPKISTFGKLHVDVPPNNVGSIEGGCGIQDARDSTKKKKPPDGGEGRAGDSGWAAGLAINQARMEPSEICRDFQASEPVEYLIGAIVLRGDLHKWGRVWK